MQQEPQDHRRFVSRRVLALIAALVALSWVPKGIYVVASSWSASAQVLEREQQIRESRERLAALQRQVDFADTDEGRDVEAKRQFGVGSPDEIWVTVDAQPAQPGPPPPQGVGDRVYGWLSTVGERCLDGARHTVRIARYLVGLDDVDDCLPAMVEVRDEPIEPEAEVEAGAPAPAHGGDERQ